MNFNQAKDKILLSLCAAAAGAMVWIAISVTQLNTNIAVVINTLKFHDTEISEIKSEIKTMKGIK